MTRKRKPQRLSSDSRRPGRGARVGCSSIYGSPDGQLRSPFHDRVILGREISALNEFLGLAVPNLAWRLVGWTWREDTVVVEWENSNGNTERAITWRGVDKFTLREGKIVEEVVYADTAVLHGLRAGTRLEPLLRFPR